MGAPRVQAAATMPPQTRRQRQRCRRGLAGKQPPRQRWPDRVERGPATAWTATCAQHTAGILSVLALNTRGALRPHRRPACNEHSACICAQHAAGTLPAPRSAHLSCQSKAPTQRPSPSQPLSSSAPLPFDLHPPQPASPQPPRPLLPISPSIPLRPRLLQPTPPST